MLKIFPCTVRSFLSVNLGLSLFVSGQFCFAFAASVKLTEVLKHIITVGK